MIRYWRRKKEDELKGWCTPCCCVARALLHLIKGFQIQRYYLKQQLLAIYTKYDCLLITMSISTVKMQRAWRRCTSQRFPRCILWHLYCRQWLPHPYYWTRTCYIESRVARILGRAWSRCQNEDKNWPDCFTQCLRKSWRKNGANSSGRR